MVMNVSARLARTWLRKAADVGPLIMLVALADWGLKAAAIATHSLISFHAKEIPWQLVPESVIAVGILVLGIRTRVSRVGVGLCVGGALGNVAELAAFGSVTDFIPVPPGMLASPADLAIIAGFLLVNVDSFRIVRAIVRSKRAKRLAEAHRRLEAAVSTSFGPPGSQAPSGVEPKHVVSGATTSRLPALAALLVGAVLVAGVLADARGTGGYPIDVATVCRETENQLAGFDGGYFTAVSFLSDQRSARLARLKPPAEYRSLQSALLASEAQLKVGAVAAQWRADSGDMAHVHGDFIQLRSLEASQELRYQSLGIFGCSN
jgi:lipoprotein signal peptidase